MATDTVEDTDILEGLDFAVPCELPWVLRDSNAILIDSCHGENTATNLLIFKDGSGTDLLVCDECVQRLIDAFNLPQMVLVGTFTDWYQVIPL